MYITNCNEDKPSNILKQFLSRKLAIKQEIESYWEPFTNDV